MKSLFRKILKEEYTPTETDFLYYEVPKKLVAQLGIELFKEEDVVYITEIHFDTQNVLFQLFSRYPFVHGEEIHYDEDRNVPGDFESNILIPIKDLPKSVLNIILRRLDPEYLKYMNL